MRVTVRFLSTITLAWFPAAVLASPFADSVVYNWDGATATYTAGAGDNMTFGPFHSSALWKDPQALLGKPNALDKDDTDWSANGQFREINMVWPAWYQGTAQLEAANTPYNANPTGATKTNNGVGLKAGSQIVVEFGTPIDDDPQNPYGIDFIVHGNPFFATGKMVYKDSNMNEYTLSAFGGGGAFGASGAGAVFEERVTVSVAQSLDGPWYTYETTFGDWFFPTQPLAWDREAINPNTGIAGDWTDQEMDWTKPVNPALVDLASEGAQAGSGAWGYFGSRTVADGLDLYAGSAGGTGFDLAESGFEWIKYVMFTDPNNRQGEICGVVDVAPVSAGDHLTMTWHNIHETGQNVLFFQDPNDPAVNLARVTFEDIDQVAYVSVDLLSDWSGFGAMPANVLGAYDARVWEVFPDEGEMSFLAELSLWVGDDYAGDGSDLQLWCCDGNVWEAMLATEFDPTTGMITVGGLMSLSSFAITQVPEPGAMLLLCMAAAGLAVMGGRRRRRIARAHPVKGAIG